MNKILMTYKNTEGLDALLNNKEFEILIHSKPDIETLKILVADVDGILIRSEVKITAEIIACAKKLKIIARAGTGVDNIDVKAATQKGIAVINVPGGNTIAACEHTMALILALARNVPAAHASLKQHKWEREKLIGTELFGKTIGLLGFGRIAREVAVRCKSFGMNVVAYDPFISSEVAGSIDARLAASPDELFALCDIISLHVPLNDQTRNLIDAKAISKMKDGVFIINTARGPILNQSDVKNALTAGKIKAAVDVFPEEPPKDFDLIDSANIVVTPHLGASTEEAQIKIAIEVAECIAEFFKSGIIRNAVNIPAIDIRSYDKLKPLLELSENIGKFQSQSIEGAIKQISVKYNGEFAEKQIYFLKLAYLKGLFSRLSDEPINYINAPIYAKNRGVTINESKSSEIEDFSILITATVTTDSETSEISGTLLSQKMPRVVRINSIPVDFNPAGCMLFVINTDMPGVIGSIGTILGKNKINIAGMDVARVAAGERAYTFVNIDVCPGAGIIDELSKIDGIHKVKYIEF